MKIAVCLLESLDSYLQGSSAVKKSLQCVARTTQSLATQNTTVQLVLHPVAFSDSEFAEACGGSVDFMLAAKPIIPNLVQRLPYAANPSQPRSLLSPVGYGARCCGAWLLSASPQRTYVGSATVWVGTAVPPTTARANRADPFPARYQALLPRRPGLRVDRDDRVANMVLPTIKTTGSAETCGQPGGWRSSSPILSACATTAIMSVDCSANSDGAGSDRSHATQRDAEAITRWQEDRWPAFCIYDDDEPSPAKSDFGLSPELANRRSGMNHMIATSA